MLRHELQQLYLYLLVASASSRSKSKDKMKKQEDSVVCLIFRRMRERGSHYRIASRPLVVIEGIVIAVATSTTNFLFTRLLKFHATVAIHGLFETCPHEKGLKMNLCKESTFNAGFTMNVQLVLAASIRLLQTVITLCGQKLPRNYSKCFFFCRSDGFSDDE